MSIKNFDKTRVAEVLAEFASPSEPIKTIERLKGRNEALITIERALLSPGRNIFIYGERGVGKSSLAATSAYQYQSSDAAPIFVTGSKDATFNSIVANIASQALGRQITRDTTSRTEVEIDVRLAAWKRSTETNDANIAAQLHTAGDAVGLLEEVTPRHSERPVIVIDEFDVIRSAVERDHFAHLLKALSDRGSKLKFIFTGVGESVHSMLEAHRSVWRQLATIEVSRLGWEARVEIVQQIADAFDLHVDENVCWRIAIVSDGFPHYVHHIVQQMIWVAFDQEDEVCTLDAEHYQLGLRKAINETNAELKGPYEKAVQARSPEMERVVWSSADTDEDFRNLNSMFDSYRAISESCRITPDNSTKFSDLVRKLKQPAYGELLQSVENRPGWYTYREKMLRGYVRMCAESLGVELTGYHPRNEPRGRISVTRAYRGTQIPKGVRLR